MPASRSQPSSAGASSSRSHPYRRPPKSQEQQSRLGTLFSYAAAPLKWGASLFLSAEATAEESEEEIGAPAQPPCAPRSCALSGLAGVSAAGLSQQQAISGLSPRLPLDFAQSIPTPPDRSRKRRLCSRPHALRCLPAPALRFLRHRVWRRCRGGPLLLSLPRLLRQPVYPGWRRHLGKSRRRRNRQRRQRRQCLRPRSSGQCRNVGSHRASRHRSTSCDSS